MHLGLIIFCIFSTAFSSKIVYLEIDSAWSQHKQEYELNFGPVEEEERKAIFFENLRFIEEYNAKKTGVTLAMNNHGHLRPSEVHYGLNVTVDAPRVLSASRFVPERRVKDSKDWRNYSVVTHVKNQGHCGSCYAFSAVGAIESHHALKYGSLEYFSEQEIVDCSTEFPDNGCNGGMPDSVFKYAIKHGLTYEKDYPYTAEAGDCKEKSKKHTSKVSSIVDIPAFDEHELVRVLSDIGPVSIGIDAGHQEFRFYKSGVLDIQDCSQIRLNHGVLAVGYNAEADPPYLIVKNSWSTKWGEDGYFRMVLYKNMCGVSTMASYPVIEKKEIN